MSEQGKYPICLYPECGRERAGRGLCPNHYKQAARFVKQGKTTWEELEVAGKVLPRKTMGRKGGEFQAWVLGKTSGGA